MTYEEFMEEFKNTFSEHANVDEEIVSLFHDGWQGSGDPAEMAFIQNTNRTYHKEESDRLEGDYLTVEKNLGGYRTLSRFSLEGLYDEFLKEGWDKVWSTVNGQLELRDKCSFEDFFSDTTTYESIKSRLVVRLRNFSDNRYGFRDICYRRFGDMALVLCVITYNENEMIGTLKVPREYPEKWGTDVNTAIDEALLNTYVNQPPRLYFRESDMEHPHPPYERGAFMALGADYHLPSPAVAPILTTYPYADGAIAMFYPGVAEKLAEVMGGSYYISFLNTNAVRLHLKGTKSLRTLLHALKSTNQMHDPDEIVTKKIYFYDAERNLLEPLEL